MQHEENFIQPNKLNLIIADDDADDCFLFEEAITELKIEANTTSVSNGVQLMQLFAQNPHAYDVLFLDLNMPQKNGFACLEELRATSAFNSLYIIILSTSDPKNIADILYKKGADFYICKPPSFIKFKNLIQQAIASTANKKTGQPAREKFIIC